MARDCTKPKQQRKEEANLNRAQEDQPALLMAVSCGLSQIHVDVGERSRKQKFSDLRTSPGPLWRLHTWLDLFRYRLIAQREVESMTNGGANPRN